MALSMAVQSNAKAMNGLTHIKWVAAKHAIEEDV